MDSNLYDIYIDWSQFCDTYKLIFEIEIAFIDNFNNLITFKF